MKNDRGLKGLSSLFVLIAIWAVCGQATENSESQLTFGPVRSECDSVVVSDLSEPGLPFYTAIKVYRKGKIIYTHKDTTIELCGSGRNLFTEACIPETSDSYLIFTASGRPGADYFLVLKKTKDTYTKLGTTPYSTAEIFGDIDYDGVFEIGGLRGYDDGGESIDESLKMIAREYQIFEIKNGFPLDSTLMKALLPTVLKNYRERLKK
jgi:hypothetical protein